MMICPESYCEELKGKSVDEVRLVIEELEQEVDRLKASLKRRNAYFKNMAFTDEIEEEWLMHPSLETRIICTKDYLREAIRALAELGEDYIPKNRK